MRETLYASSKNTKHAQKNQKPKPCELRHNSAEMVRLRRMNQDRSCFVEDAEINSDVEIPGRLAKECVMNRMFSDRVKRVMQLAREEAARLGHNYIGTEHLLLGIIREGECSATQVLMNLDLNPEDIKQSVDDYVASSRGSMPRDKVPFTPRSKQVLEIAGKEAKNMESPFVRTSHLLLYIAASYLAGSVAM